MNTNQGETNVFIGLGSNQGDRLQFLQLAVNQIREEIGTILQISPIFETKSWGFDADNFYNACIEVRTSLKSEEVLQNLLKIEENLGRIRLKTTQKYASRPIDLDILLFGKEIIHTKNLIVPHQYLTKRKFVLEPLSKIASEVIHPTEMKTIGQINDEFQEETTIKMIKNTLQCP